VLRLSMNCCARLKPARVRGGALGEAEAIKRGNTVGIRDQVMDLVAGQGFKVSRKRVNESSANTNNKGL
jgi:hypothetical protein